jgi:hypothetical protein
VGRPCEGGIDRLELARGREQERGGFAASPRCERDLSAQQMRVRMQSIVDLT